MSNISDLVKLAKDAEKFLSEIKQRKPEGIKLQGKRPSTLKATAIHYLARKRGLNVTIHDLSMIFGVYPPTIMNTEKILKELDGTH